MSRLRLDEFRAPTPFTSLPTRTPSASPRTESVRDDLEQGPADGEETASHSSMLNGMILQLTPRRREVLELVARGLTNREIADVMGISANTVKVHLARVLETLELSNRTEAAIALQQFDAQTGGATPG